MIGVFPFNITNAMVTSSTVAEPDTTETAWSSSEIVVASAERIIAAPSSTVTPTIANPCVVTWADNGLAVDTEVVFSTSGSLPTGLVAGTTYYVAARLSSSTFTLKDDDGRTITTTGSQSGTHTMTAKVHKVYQAAVGGSATVSSVDTGTDRLTVTAHGFTAGQIVVFTSTGTLPSPLVAGTLYQVVSPTTNDFKLDPYGGGADVDLTTTGSGTITVGYVSASVEPNYNKPPAINSTYWTEVGPTNKWSMFDDNVVATTDAASSISVTIVPGAAWDSVAILNHNASAITARFEINRATVTFDAGTDKCNWTSNNLADGDPICFTNSGGALPAELTSGTTYYAKSPGANDTQIAATVGGAAINLSGAGTGTHTAGEVAATPTLDATKRIPYATGIVSEANQSVAAYQNGTLTVTATGTGTVSIGEMLVGLSIDMGTTADDVASGIKNYSPISRDDFGNVTITSRGYTAKLRANVMVETAATINEVNDWLIAHKDDFVLLIAEDTIEAHSIYGLIVDWEMSSDSKDYKVLRLEAEGLVAA